LRFPSCDRWALNLQVDVHVVGQLPLPLGPFLFLASFHVLGIGEALSQELPALVVLTHLAMGHARFNKTGLRNKNNKNWK